MKMTIMDDASQWIMLPPGDVAISRRPLSELPQGTSIAHARDLLVANLGYPFPWGSMPEPTKSSKLWHKHRIGMGGLIHAAWFVTQEGRLGGAPNIPDQLPGTLRACLLYDGGEGSEAENEGYAVLRPTSDADRKLYRLLQLHAAEHIAADRGALLISPIEEGKRAFIGFGGRCQQCPNPEHISFRQAKQALQANPAYRECELELYPEWKNWSL